MEERAATREDARRPGEVRRILDGVLAVWHQYKSEPHQQDGMLSRLKTYLYSLPRDMMVRVMADVTNSCKSNLNPSWFLACSRGNLTGSSSFQDMAWRRAAFLERGKASKTIRS